MKFSIKNETMYSKQYISLDIHTYIYENYYTRFKISIALDEKTD